MAKIPTNNTSGNDALIVPKAKDVEMHQNVDAIGILQFLQGKDFLITGGTGFLAKVLIEKILREVPDVGKIYLLIKAKNKEAAMQRLKTEVLNTELFKILEKTYGQSYNAFVLSKLVHVTGNICDSNFGIQEDVASQIAQGVHIIVNCAATTTFDERYDVALNINTKGPCNLISFAKRCKQLKLFLHVSTAYANGERRGKIIEKPFRVGDCIARENISFEAQHVPSSSLSLPPILDVEAEFKFASTYSKEAFSENSFAGKMKEIGLARAKMFGWQDAYVFTKAMGEMMIDKLRENVPVVIVRPSTIESTLKEPFPGWIQGNRVMDPMILNYGEGKISGFPGDPKTVMDIVPADMVANAILAAIARHGSMHESGANGNIKIYQVGSSVANPLTIQDLVKLFYEHFHLYPCIGSKGRPVKVSTFTIFSSAQDLSAALARNSVMASSRSNGSFLPRNEFILKRLMKQVERLCDVYMPYTFFNGRFDISNTITLMEEMSEEEKKKFDFDVRSIDWKYYIKEVHIVGLRRHVMMKGKIESML